MSEKLAYHFIKILILQFKTLYNNYITNTTTGMQDSESYARDRQIKQDISRRRSWTRVTTPRTSPSTLLSSEVSLNMTHNFEDNGTDIDVWEYHELSQAVIEYQSRFYRNEEGYMVPKVQELQTILYLGNGVSPMKSQMDLFGVKEVLPEDEVRANREALLA